MTAVALQSTEAAPGRGLAGLLVLVSIVAIAQSSDHLDLSVTPRRLAERSDLRVRR